MAFTVSHDDLISLTRRMIQSSMEWVEYQNKATGDKTLSASNKDYYRSRWSEEVGRNTAYMHAFAVITHIPWTDVDTALKNIVGSDTNQDKLTPYAYALFEALGIKESD